MSALTHDHPDFIKILEEAKNIVQQGKKEKQHSTFYLKHRHLSGMDRPDEKVCAVNYRKVFRNGRIAKPGSTQ